MKWPSAHRWAEILLTSIFQKDKLSHPTMTHNTKCASPWYVISPHLLDTVTRGLKDADNSPTKTIWCHLMTFLVSDTANTRCVFTYMCLSFCQDIVNYDSRRRLKPSTATFRRAQSPASLRLEPAQYQLFAVICNQKLDSLGECRWRGRVRPRSD